MQFPTNYLFNLLKNIEISNRTISSNVISAKKLILFNTFFQLRHNICILWSQKISSQSWMIISLDFHFCGSTVNTRFINKTNFVWIQFITKGKCCLTKCKWTFTIQVHLQWNENYGFKLKMQRTISLLYSIEIWILNYNSYVLLVSIIYDF